MPPRLQATAGISIPSNLPGCYTLTNRLGRAASPAKVGFVSGAKDQTASISEHTFVSFGCTLSGITCLPRQTRSHPELHKPGRSWKQIHGQAAVWLCWKRVESWHRYPAAPANIAFICRATEQMIRQLFIWRTGFTSLD